jgi:hypothetical protein
MQMWLFFMDAAEGLAEHEWCDDGFDVRDVCVLFEGFGKFFQFSYWARDFEGSTEYVVASFGGAVCSKDLF